MLDGPAGALIGLVSDTHAVFDPAAASALQDVQLLLHAGDVGHHGGHAAILKAFAAATGAPVLAVSDNVDDRPDTETEGLLPSHRLLSVAGWRLLLVHIVAPGPTSKVAAAAAALVTEHKPDLVVCGHSHKAATWKAGSVTFINPGSAGPARFKLQRSVAKLWLPPRQASGASLDLDIQALGPLNPPTAAAGSAPGPTAAGPTVAAVLATEPVVAGCRQEPSFSQAISSSQGAVVGGPAHRPCVLAPQPVLQPVEPQSVLQPIGPVLQPGMAQHGKAWLQFVSLPQKAPPRLKPGSRVE